VITVGATDIANTVSAKDDFAAPWSAYGYTVDGFAKPELSAPGRYMVGAVPPDSSLAVERVGQLVAPGYMQLSGTSFAAPVIAGAAADILAAHPSWTPDQVKGALMLEPRATPSAAPFSTGVGEVNAAEAAEVDSPPNPNAALNHFLVPDPEGGPLPVFDAAAWADAAKANPAWDDAAWTGAAWTDPAWTSAAWTSAAWTDAAWTDAGWTDAFGDVTGEGGYWIGNQDENEDENRDG
jgi:subtilisin family serine protease